MTKYIALTDQNGKWAVVNAFAIQAVYENIDGLTWVSGAGFTILVQESVEKVIDLCVQAAKDLRMEAIQQQDEFLQKNADKLKDVM